MFASSLSPVVCRRALVLFTLCSGRLYLQLFVGGLLSYLRYVRVRLYLQLFVGGLLSYLRYVRLYLQLFGELSSYLRYVQLFVGGLLSYLRYVRFVFISSCL